MYKYAEIIVSISHSSVDKPFNYKIPNQLKDKILIGMRVAVPFGRGDKKIEGYVIGFSNEIDFDENKAKYISYLLDEKQVFDENMLELAYFMKEKYLTTLMNCIKCIIPTGSKMKNLSKMVKIASLNYELDGFETITTEIILKETAQSDVINLLKEQEKVSVQEIKEVLQISDSPIKTLAKNKIIIIENEEIIRDLGIEHVKKTVEPTYTQEQENAILFITNKMNTSNIKPTLIHGVTGSGKTEIYMKLISNAILMGKDAILLVPEISLTPQIVNVFMGRFGDKVAITHSRLSLGERFDQWKKARDGTAKIMIGPRSAIFAPFKNLGIIIIDEEHENTYKSEVTPKYSAKDIAIKRGELVGAQVIFGSATPSLETYYKAQNYDMDLVVLKNRVNNRYPEVIISDMRIELEEGNMSIFSHGLQEKMKETLAKNEQIILFLNRRGHSTFVSCRKCGHVLKCENCNINYTYHKYTNNLMCHYCGDTINNPENCPVCGSKFIKYFGIGTQRVEKEIKELFPLENVLRMDMDTTTTKNSHSNILSTFREGKASILIGTQMIAKGLDFPKVTLVGVIAADLSINAGDYRSGETTFQLLTQVSGRAGRASKDGTVFIQTYKPEHYSVIFAQNNDYEQFYNHELAIRRQMNYPPFTHVFSILFTSGNEKDLIIMLYKLLEIMIYYNKKGKFDMIGPAPAMISKINKLYRWKIIVKAVDEKDLRNFVVFCMDKLEKTWGVGDTLVSMTIDPVVAV